ncbi:MAG: hypothetical protein AAF560_18350 [Acidobacteriota bacterium]
MEQQRRNRIAQWVFDTRPILGRFHLWLEDVEEHEMQGFSADGSFVGHSLRRSFAMAAAVTALGTRLFGRFGEGQGLDKSGLNRVKKDADAVSAYVMSESLWYLTRRLPENHAVMVCLGEGLMPKGGETPEMGSNPLLGFGRIYARPEVAKFLEQRVHRLINANDYSWDDFWAETQEAGISIWGAAIDTLENTSRFAKGKTTGPMTVLHLYDQPLVVATPYEGYFGNLILPRTVADKAAEDSILLTYRTPRETVMKAILAAYPDLAPERVHVWTLGGSSRERRLGGLWDQWRALGAHVMESDWRLPGGGEIFNDSGTYAPMFSVGLHRDDEGFEHLVLCDGYAASAEAIQAAGLDPVLDVQTSLSLFSSAFRLPCESERNTMRLDPEASEFADQLAAVAGEEVASDTVEQYRESIRSAQEAGLPVDRADLTIDDLFPRKRWRCLTLDGFIQPDPYSGAAGVEEVGERTYRVTVRVASEAGLKTVTLTLRLEESLEESRLVFSPLLDRFHAGQDFRSRAVKVSDSGRLRNELQTLCSGGLEYLDENRMRLHLDRIDDAVLSAPKKHLIREVLGWYQQHHPIWFHWLEIAE